MNWILNNLWLIPALPLLAAGLGAVTRRPGRLLAASLAIGSMALAFGLSCAAFAQTLHDPAARLTHNFDWFVLGETTLRLGWVLDPLTASMLLMITFVGTLIFIFSVGYMEHDDNFTRFFCFLSLFAAAMLGLVIANSLLLLFMCWELVGLASYLLIGFWFHKPSAAAAAKKAFITTRIGDVFFLLGILWLYAETGTLLFYDGGAGCLEQSALAKLIGQSTMVGMGVGTAIGLLVFCGAIGKSGQFPLHVWLPDAMEGPTPVSALIHAATMVAAGVFLVARVYPLMEAAPAKPAPVEVAALVAPASSTNATKATNATNATNATDGAKGTNEKPATVVAAIPGAGLVTGEHPKAHAAGTVSTALQTVTWIGAITALFAALVAVAQTDIKRILAYSTVSQLGFMFMGLGMGGVAVGMFHLLTHAFFKALLFLGSGSVIHGCHEEQDIRRMGGLRRWMPVTFATYAIGMMALSGVPLFFSGFWSKDEILHAAWLWQPSEWKLPFLMGICAAFLTAFYMTRQMWYVFFGQNRAGMNVAHAHGGDHSDPISAGKALVPHESPPTMTFPLAVLAVCAIGLSIFGTPVWPWFHSYLSGHEVHSSTSIEVGTLLVMALSSVIALGGIVAGWRLYSRRGPRNAAEPDPLETLFPESFKVLRGKFFIDELYQISVLRWNGACAAAARWFDEFLMEHVVRGVSWIVVGVSWIGRTLDEWVVNPGFDRGCLGLRQGAWLLALWQNGQVQRYLRVIGLALTIGALFFHLGVQMNGIITALTLTPLLGAALIAGLEKEQRTLARWLGLGFNAIALGLTALLWWKFDATSGQPQFEERYQWIPSLNVDYFVAVDGLSLLMVLLAALLMPFALLASWRIADNTKAFVSLMLFLQAGLFGAFTALNFVHWFVFWELTLVPAYFLIKLWGGSRRSEAATQFFIYTMVGSVTLLLSMLAVYLVTGSWDFRELAEKGRSGELASLFNVKLGWYALSARTLSLLIFFGAFLGFAVKVPLVPFHTWLPATYAEAPTGVSMVLTGVMSKMGVYGFLRVLMPIFPNEMRDPLVQNLLLLLAVATIVGSAWAAMAQRDLKRVVAYSSINHLGYCLLGIFAATQATAGDDARWTTEKAAALNGVVLQMFNHGITAAALFYFVGLIEQRAGRRGLEDFGGLRKAAPVFCGLMGIVMFASLGLPGLSGFVGEFLIFKGTFALTSWAAVLSVMGLLTTAVFLLTILQRVWNGPLDAKWNGFSDLTRGERCLVFPAIALMFILGLCPQLVLGVVNSTVLQLVEGLKL